MGDLKQALADALDGARQRSLGLLDPLSEEDQRAQHPPDGPVPQTENGTLAVPAGESSEY